MDYFRKATETSPTVIMDSHSKSVLIKGNSICRNRNAYERETNAIKRKLEKSDYTDVNIKLDVFDMQTAKSLLDLFKSIKNNKRKITTAIHWLCESADEEMRQMGRDYSELLEMEFNISSN